MVDIPGWRTRTSPVMTLISPFGETYTPKWAGDSISMTKHVQRDGFPLIAGEYGKDLGGTSSDFNSTIYFDGLNCDLFAAAFEAACTQVGYWQMVHPVKGYKRVLLVSIKQDNDPIKSGGVVSFETVWFQGFELIELGYVTSLAALVAGLSDVSVPVVATAFDTSLLMNGMGAVLAVGGMAQIVSQITYAAVNGTSWLVSVSSSFAEIAKDKWDNSNNDLDEAIAQAQEDEANFDAVAISTAMSGMLMATAYGNEDTNKVLNNMETAVDGMIAALPSGTFTGILEMNRAYTLQTAMEGAIIAACYGTSYGVRTTRRQAIDASTRLTTLWESIVEALDGVAAAFEGNRADRQYYSQTETYATIHNLVSQTKKMLGQQIYDLAIEKVFTLEEDKTPIRICFEEFKEKGEDYIDLFIEWNELEGDDILLLQAGREVKVYVEAA